MKNIGTLTELDSLAPRARKQQADKEFLRQQIEEARHDEDMRRRVKDRAHENLKAIRKDANPFPVDAFPPSIAEFINSHVRTYGFPADWYAGAIMTIGGAIIGNAYAAEYERFWTGSPYFWVFMVGNMSTGKSQVLKHTLFPIKEFQKKLFEENAAKYQAWENNKTANGKDFDEKEPEARRIMLNKFSMEKALQLMQDNPRGILMYRDELRGWVNSFNQYRKGDDEETILELWDNGDKMIDMVKGSIYIQRTYMAVLGGIQPQVMQSLASNERSVNGFIVRCLFAYPDDLSKPYPTRIVPDFDVRNRYMGFMEYLHKLPNRIISPDPAIKYSPTTVESVRLPFTDAAKEAFFQYLKNSTDKQNKCDNEVDRGFLGKFDTYVIRWAALLKMFDLAEERAQIDKDDIEDNDGRPVLKGVTIDTDVLARALMIMEYFKKSSERVTMRIESVVNELPVEHQSWYRALTMDEPLKTKFLIETAREAGIAQRTAEKMIADMRLFKQIKTGWYERRCF